MPVPLSNQSSVTPSRTHAQKLRVGFLVIATNRYTAFLPQLLESVERHFMRGEQVSVYVFTDRPDQVPAGAIPCLVPHRGWPYATLLRFHHLMRHREALAAEDYLFQCDADMRFVGPVGREILPNGMDDHGLVGVEHPGFCWKPSILQRVFKKLGGKVPRGRPPRARFTYETDSRSTACMRPDEGVDYFMGAFTGGETSAYLRMAEILQARIEADLSQDFIAVWHDESQLNRYYWENRPRRLDPGYCYPEKWRLPFERRILALDKNHSEIRQ